MLPRKQSTLTRLPGAVLALFALAAPSSASASGLQSILSPTTQQVGQAVTAVAPASAPVVDAVASTVIAPVQAAAPTCVDSATTAAFSKWGDTAQYSPAPDGTFEAGGAGWQLSKGASIVKGNETLGVTTGSKSLQLTSGATATSPQFCVSEQNPYFRFVVKGGFFFSTYQALVLYRDSAGTLTQAQFVSSTGSQLLPGIWAASSVSPLAVSIPLLSGGKTATVQIVLASLTGGASFDSLMVDPYRRG